LIKDSSVGWKGRNKILHDNSSYNGYMKGGALEGSELPPRATRALNPYECVATPTYSVSIMCLVLVHRTLPSAMTLTRRAESPIASFSAAAVLVSVRDERSPVTTGVPVPRSESFRTSVRSST